MKRYERWSNLESPLSRGSGSSRKTFCKYKTHVVRNKSKKILFVFGIDEVIHLYGITTANA